VGRFFVGRFVMLGLFGNWLFVGFVCLFWAIVCLFKIH
jgi:hypothetical protein